VLLPADAASAPIPASPPARPLPARSRRARVLVVDDDALVASAIRRTLRQHEVTIADGEGAVARVEAGEVFDVVLCDLMMPVMTGMQVHARIHALAPGLAEHMIFISGGAFTPAAQAFIRDRRPRLVPKPFDPDELRRAVDEVLA
jgi:CheY-like chemotaxis protein